MHDSLDEWILGVSSIFGVKVAFADIFTLHGHLRSSFSWLLAVVCKVQRDKNGCHLSMEVVNFTELCAL